MKIKDIAMGAVLGASVGLGGCKHVEHEPWFNFGLDSTHGIKTQIVTPCSYSIRNALFDNLAKYDSLYGYNQYKKENDTLKFSVVPTLDTSNYLNSNSEIANARVIGIYGSGSHHIVVVYDDISGIFHEIVHSACGQQISTEHYDIKGYVLSDSSHRVSKEIEESFVSYVSRQSYRDIVSVSNAYRAGSFIFDILAESKTVDIYKLVQGHQHSDISYLYSLFFGNKKQNFENIVKIINLFKHISQLGDEYDCMGIVIKKEVVKQVFLEETSKRDSKK